MAKESDSDPALDLEHKHEWLRPLAREYVRAMRKPVSPLLARSTIEWQALSGMVLDFIIDLQSGAHLWSAYERWNVDLFGHPLPISEGDPGDGVSSARVRHFLWRATALLEPGLLVPPDHPDIAALTEVTLAFWDKRKAAFKSKERYSRFVSEQNGVGWVVKGKLVDLGQTSYFFRSLLISYVRTRLVADADADTSVINIIDDFLCGECTGWSGMGVVDLLAGALDLPEERRADVRAWADRLVSVYRIDGFEKDVFLAGNLLGGGEYRIADDGLDTARFPRGAVLFGAIVPWDGGWRWSGAPLLLHDPADREEPFDLEELRSALKRDMGPVVCRVWSEFREETLRLAAESYRQRVDVSEGRDFMVLDSFAAFEDLATKVAELHPASRFVWLDGTPRSVTGEVAVFHTLDGSSELYFNYQELKAALAKKGEGLTGDETDRLVDLIESGFISPEFVRRVVGDNPSESIWRACGIPDNPPAYALEWLLRCNKGGYYRTQYPYIGPEKEVEE